MAIARSAALWAPEHCRRGPAGWEAFSHARSVEHNVVICDGPGQVAGAMEALRAVGQPGLVMLAGDALGDAAELAAASWACVGAMPLLALDLDRLRAGPSGSAV